MPRSIEELERDLRSWWPARYRTAAEEFARTGGSRAVKALLAALAHPLAHGQLTAVRALGRLGDEDALLPVALLVLNGRARAGSRLHRACLETTRLLLEHASMPGPVIRILWRVPGHGRAWPPDAENAVVQALVRMGRALVVPVIQTVRGRSYWIDDLSLLTDHDSFAPALREVAALGGRAKRRPILGWVRLAPATIEPLFGLLKQPDRRSRLWAAEALGQIGTPPVSERLACLFDGGEEGARLPSAVGLAHAGDARGLQALVRALCDDAYDSRVAAAEALGRLGANAGPALELVREHEHTDLDREVRAACQEATREIERALRDAPAELEAAPVPAGSGVEPEAAGAPTARGSWRPGREAPTPPVGQAPAAECGQYRCSVAAACTQAAGSDVRARRDTVTARRSGPPVAERYGERPLQRSRRRL